MDDYLAHVRVDGDTQSLQDHLLDVARLASRNAGKIGLSAHGELLGLLHDIGKFSAAFQSYLKSATDLLDQDTDENYVDAGGLKGKIDHSTAGAQIVWGELGGQGVAGRIAGQVLALCVASHHSGLIDCIGAKGPAFGQDVFGGRMDKADERTHLQEAWSKVDPDIRDRIVVLLSDSKIREDLVGTVKRISQSLPDGVADSKIIEQQQVALLVRFLFSCLIDADRLDTATFEKPRANRHRPHGCYADWERLIGNLEAHLAGFEPREPIDDLRRDISRHCLSAAARERGIYSLTVPTGGGKTLASLRFAMHHAARYGMDRIIYVIPFTSIIDQNAEVVRAILETEDDPASVGRVVLEHHGNLTPEIQGWRDKMLTENWDAPVIYTTMVQFLEALFGAGTRGARRMHQLANAVLIFDEVQSLPVSCVHLFNNAVNFLVDTGGSTAVLCTATQPLLDKVDASQGAIKLLEDAEIMPNVGRLFANLKRTEVLNRHKAGGWTPEEIAALAIDEANAVGSCLVVVNTKRAAREVYRLVTAQVDIPVFHLSTNMCPAHRKARLAEMRKRLDRRKPVLCVSTQLIEAGVDIDFGAVIRYAAGLDSIAQAAGRCNRHGRRPTGRVHVVNPCDENIDALIDIRIGRDKTARMLDDYADDPARFGHNLIGPAAMAWYYENYFFARKDDMRYPVPAGKLGHDDMLTNLLSTNALAVAEYGQRKGKAPDVWLRQAFMTAAKAFKAIDAPTQGVIVPHGDRGRELVNDLCAAIEVERQINLLRRAQQFTVNVFPGDLRKLQESGALHPVQEDSAILHLDPRHYSAEFGLVTEPVNPMETLLS
ncbi:MAG: CRISPR-associated helicase Cas3' [Candidatus Nitricoxidivorans perseverans]|uniref:CRISPR-associated helicase Cas3 n=1 Tax=Candidatus Nitricoxidivorans perseverans TaxID=2975601 RepID=A0AA49IYG5_9PROT|nr:MAG: CRISPR-associated helicase Cas3' [Candidatus Nitricoxidivorans perseverans]